MDHVRKDATALDHNNFAMPADERAIHGLIPARLFEHARMNAKDSHLRGAVFSEALRRSASKLPGRRASFCRCQEG